MEFSVEHRSNQLSSVELQNKVTMCGTKTLENLVVQVCICCTSCNTMALSSLSWPIKYGPHLHGLVAKSFRLHPLHVGKIPLGGFN